MSEDFHQERKWKKATAFLVAQWVKEWHESTNRESLCIKPKRPVPISHTESEDSSAQLELAAAILNDAPSILDGMDENESFKTPEQEISPVLQIPPIDPWKSTGLANSQTVDPRSLMISAPITISLDTNVYFTDNNDYNSNLDAVPTFKPPEYNEGDVYIEEAFVVPVSRFMLGDFYVQEPNTWDLFGTSKEVVLPEKTPKLLPGVQKYNKDEGSVGIFCSQQDEDIQPPRIARPDSMKSTGSWTSDEEDALWQLVNTYGSNWPLIEAILSGSKVGNNTIRSIWCCYDKFKELQQHNFVPHSKAEYIYGPCQTNKKDKKVKVLGILSTFNFITNLAKKRDANKPQCKVFLYSYQVQQANQPYSPRNSSASSDSSWYRYKHTSSWAY
jgi:hypothetical protein